MGVRLVVGHENGTDIPLIAMFDSVTGFAFGPTFRSVEDALSFLALLSRDARLYSQRALAAAYQRWCRRDTEESKA